MSQGQRVRIEVPPRLGYGAEGFPPSEQVSPLEIRISHGLSHSP